MVMLKCVKIEPCESINPSILSQQDIEASIAKAVSIVTEKSKSRRQCNSYSKEQHAMLGKDTAENGPTCAAKHICW